MATPQGSKGVVGGNTAGVSVSVAEEKVDWSGFKPTEVGFEDAMSMSQCKKVWEKIYLGAGVPSGSEDEKRSIRAACYVYATLNGTSRAGNYAAEIKSSTGVSFNASVIVQATGKLAIRKFFRGNMVEAYRFLKTSGVMETYDRFVANVANKGISAECAFATADFLGDCPLFTPAENKAHQTEFVTSTERARRARGGRSLEDVERAEVREVIETQGPNGVADDEF
jgi:hypothetical protein